MLKKTIKYEDYNGMEREEDFYFNLTQSELMEMEMTTEGGLKNKLEKIAKKLDGPEIMKFFKDIILKSYCIKSDDGRRLIKSAKAAEEFTQTPAYDKLFMELLTVEGATDEFIKKVLPTIDESSIPAPPAK